MHRPSSSRHIFSPYRYALYFVTNTPIDRHSHDLQLGLDDNKLRHISLSRSSTLTNELHAAACLILHEDLVPKANT